MAYDKGLAQLLRERVEPLGTVVEKRMFGGLCFMLRGHMLCGVNGARLMMRVGKQHQAQALELPGSGAMDFTGTPLGGFIYLDPEVAEDDGIDAALELARAFNATLPPKD